MVLIGSENTKRKSLPELDQLDYGSVRIREADERRDGPALRMPTQANAVQSRKLIAFLSRIGGADLSIPLASSAHLPVIYRVELGAFDCFSASTTGGA